MRRLLLAALLLIGGGLAYAEPANLAVCAACHGETGTSPTPNWPTLAGQHKDYLVEVMMQYRNGQRDDPVMAGQLINLSDDDIKDLAAFYAAQPGLFTAGYE